MSKDTYSSFQVNFFIFLLGAMLILSFLIFQPYLVLLIIAGILAVVLYPLYEKTLSFFNMKATFAAISIVFLVLLVVLIPVVLIVTSLTFEVLEVLSQLKTPTGVNEVRESLSRVIGDDIAGAITDQASLVVINFVDYIRPIAGAITSNVVKLFSNISRVLLGFFLIMVSLYYFLKDGKKLREELLMLSPLSDRYDTKVLESVTTAMHATVHGYFVVGILKGLLAGVSFWILGLSAPVMMGTLVLLASFIPGIGTGLVLIPYVIYLFLVKEFFAGIILLFISIFIVGLVDNFLSPKLIQEKVHIHPLLIILSIFGGLRLFGIFGFLLGPIALSVTMGLIDIYKEGFRGYLEKA